MTYAGMTILDLGVATTEVFRISLQPCRPVSQGVNEKSPFDKFVAVNLG